MVIDARSVGKTFQQGKIDVEVLKGIDLQVGAGESHAILGASGTGKSTLMHLLGGLDHVSSGEISIGGVALSGLSEARLGKLRNQQLGFIYQFHHLLPEFSAVENIAMPLLIRGESFQAATRESLEWLEKIGLQHRAAHKPGELSGGERQRVALARALVTHPACLLADEPTGNLDQKTATRMLDLMLGLNRELKTALVVVTHDLSIAQRMQYQWEMGEGLLTQAS